MAAATITPYRIYCEGVNGGRTELCEPYQQIVQSIYFWIFHDFCSDFDFCFDFDWTVYHDVVANDGAPFERTNPRFWGVRQKQLILQGVRTTLFHAFESQWV